MPGADIQQNVQRIFSGYLEHGGHRKTPERFDLRLIRMEVSRPSIMKVVQ